MTMQTLFPVELTSILGPLKKKLWSYSLNVLEEEMLQAPSSNIFFYIPLDTESHVTF